MAWPAMATASRARASVLQSSKAIWWAARSSVPIRAATAVASTREPRSAVVRTTSARPPPAAGAGCRVRAQARRRGTGRPARSAQVDGRRRPLGDDRRERRGPDALVEARRPARPRAPGSAARRPGRRRRASGCPGGREVAGAGQDQEQGGQAGQRDAEVDLRLLRHRRVVGQGLMSGSANQPRTARPTPSNAPARRPARPGGRPPARRRPRAAGHRRPSCRRRGRCTGQGRSAAPMPPPPGRQLGRCPGGRPPRCRRGGTGARRSARRRPVPRAWRSPDPRPDGRSSSGDPEHAALERKDPWLTRAGDDRNRPFEPDAEVVHERRLGPRPGLEHHEAALQ